MKPVYLDEEHSIPPLAWRCRLSVWRC